MFIFHYKKTAYSNYEVIIVDNGSKKPETFALFKKFQKQDIKILRHDSPFNFSFLNNFAVTHANGEMLCLMNNDIEVISNNWLEELVSIASQPEIGCVGARLWYPDMRLQHGGHHSWNR